MAEPGDERREQDGGADLERPPREASDTLRGERQQAERGDRRQQGPTRQEEALSRGAPGEREPGAGRYRVKEREPRGVVSQREHRDGEREREPQPRPGEREGEREQPQQRGEGGGEERHLRGSPAGEESRSGRSGELDRDTQRDSRRSRPAAHALGEGLSKVVREHSCGWPGSRV